MQSLGFCASIVPTFGVQVCPKPLYLLLQTVQVKLLLVPAPETVPIPRMGEGPQHTVGAVQGLGLAWGVLGSLGFREFRVQGLGSLGFRDLGSLGSSGFWVGLECSVWAGWSWHKFLQLWQGYTPGN